METEPNYKIWGKHGYDGAGEIHPALFHMIDTGFVALHILSEISEIDMSFIERNTGLSKTEIFTVMPFLVPLHDLGKITPEFVSQYAEAAQELEKEGYRFPESTKKIRHEKFSYILAQKFLPDFSFRRQICDILGGHHGRYSFIPRNNINKEEYENIINKSGFDQQIWKEQQQIAYKIIGEIFPCDINLLNKIDLKEPFYFYFSGFLSLIDWIASDKELFPYAGSNMSWQEYVETIPEKINKIPAKVPFSLAKPQSLTWQDIFGHKPYQTQQLIADEIQNVDKPCLLIIEDSTGNGKTEIAEFCANKLMINVGHKGMQFLMPTQATADNIFKRIINFIEKSTKGRANTQLGYSGSWANKEYWNIKPKNVGDGSVVAEEWFTSDNRKLIAQFGDSTVDQALMSILPVKYFFMRLFGLSNKVIVVDEVHSYDAYMLTLLERLIKELKRLDCSVILLSATLSKGIRKRLVNAFGSEITKEAEYPRVTLVNNGVTTVKSLPVVRPKKIKLNHFYVGMAGPEKGESGSRNDIVCHVLDKIKNGGCAAVVCNTVKDSQEMYDLFLSKADCPIHLIHARYTKKDKVEIENKIFSLFGIDKSGDKPTKRPIKAVVIGTQIIEQSLNIDFDFMVSFLCPIDLLIQRLGRLFRFSNFSRPNSFKEPEASIIYEFKKNGNIQNYVYESLPISLTWKALRFKDSLNTPEEVDKIINSVYVESVEGLEKEDVDFFKQKERHKVEKTQQASNWALNLDPLEVIHPKQNDMILSPDAVLVPSGLDERPKTRDIVLSTKVIIVFRRKGKWCLDKEGKFLFQIKTEYSPEEKAAIKGNLCPVIGNPLYDYFSARKIKKWKDISELRHHAILVLEDEDKKIISGGKWTANLSYGDAGLRTVIESRNDFEE